MAISVYEPYSSSIATITHGSMADAGAVGLYGSKCDIYNLMPLSLRPATRAKVDESIYAFVTAPNDGIQIIKLEPEYIPAQTSNGKTAA